MHGLVSLLPSPQYEQVKTIWDELEFRFGFKGIRVTPYPHFSWQIGACYPQDLLEEAMQEICANLKPIKVTTTGLGLFSGPTPVIFIPVVKSPALVDMHRHIWERFLSVTHTANEFYNPENWMPHISIAYDDITPANIGAVMEWLAFQTFDWCMEIDNFAFVFEPDESIGTLQKVIRFGCQPWERSNL